LDAYCGEGFGASGGAGGINPDVQGAADDLQVTGQGEHFAQERAGFAIPADVARTQ